jgi:hypothetical protein
MLLVLIPIAWLAVAAIVVALCRRAASADAIAAAPWRPGQPAREDAPLLSLPGLTVWDCSDPVHARSAARALVASSKARPAQRRRDARERSVGAGSRARGVHRGNRSLARS